MLKRFNALAKRFGFKIRPTSCFVNGTFTRRPDILSVQYKHKHYMTIPKRIYGFPNDSCRNLIGLVNPDYFTLEYTLKSWNNTLKNTNYINEKEAKEKSI